MSDQDWIGALHLATMWEFHQVWNIYSNCFCFNRNIFGPAQVRERAIIALKSYVSSQDQKNTVLLAKKYRVIDWLRTAYKQLVQRPSLGIPDLTGPEPLDWETIAKIFFLRQTITQKQPPACSCCSPPDTSSSELEEIFRDEFESMKEQSDHSQVDPPLPCMWVFGSC